LVMKLNTKPYINAKLFLHYIRTVLLPNLAELRRADDGTEEMALPLMDNSQSNCSMSPLPIRCLNVTPVKTNFSFCHVAEWLNKLNDGRFYTARMADKDCGSARFGLTRPDSNSSDKSVLFIRKYPLTNQDREGAHVSKSKNG
jgi:hypothetical protein